MGKSGLLFAKSVLLCSLVTIGAPAMGADAASDLNLDNRSVARLMAQAEDAMDKRDLKGYCAVTVGTPEYPGYVALACLERAERKLKKIEDCSLTNVKKEAKRDIDQCLAMSTEQFGKRISEQSRGRDAWIKEMKRRGVDGEKLLREERAKL